MADTATRPTRRDPSSAAIGALLAIGVTVMPFLVEFVAIFFVGRVVPWGDDALLELTVRTVGHHTVLLGPYSRFHWHHPGPLLFDWLAIPYHAFGSRPGALYQGALLTAAISVGLVGWIAFRRGSARLAWCTMAIVGIYVWAVGPDIVSVPWNPWITILPLLAVMCLAWSATCGDLWAYPLAAAGGAFLVQSHVEYAVITVAVLALSAIIIIGRAVRHRAEWRRVGWVALVTAGLLAALWSLPIYEELTRDPGNMTKLSDFSSVAQADHSLSDGIEITAHELGAIPAQVVGLDSGAAGHRAPPMWSGIVTLAALVLATVIAARRRAWSALKLALLVAAGTVAAAFSAANVVGPIQPYLVVWITAVGTGAWVALGAAILTPGSTPAPFQLRRRIGVVAAAVAVGLAVINSYSALVAEPPSAAGTKTIPPLLRGIVPALGRPSAGPIYIRLASTNSWPFAAGVILALDRRGYDTLVDPDFGWLLGEGKSKPANARVATIVTFANPTDAPSVRAQPGQREVAHQKAFLPVLVFVQPGDG